MLLPTRGALRDDSKNGCDSLCTYRNACWGTLLKFRWGYEVHQPKRQISSQTPLEYIFFIDFENLTLNF